jgi:SAM-dependent methyltransferase
MLCRVCQNELGSPIYASSAPAITSLATILVAPTRVYACSACGHCQSEDLPSLDAFYDTDYKISLASDDHDQVYEVRDGKSVFRTDRQAEVAVNLVGMHPSAKILDYGAAKATTLRKIIAQWPNASPHVFDVSEDYRSYWASWLPNDACATYKVPSNWRGLFDVVTAHYVIEHVSNPIAVLAELRGLLAPGGKLFFSVPDWTQNTGDLLVVDHVNHFSETSVRTAACSAGLEVDLLASNQLPGAFVVVCSPSKSPSAPPIEKVTDEVGHARAACSFWAAVVTTIDNSCESRRDRPSAIFGVGFYGSLVHSRVGKKVPISCFLDNNPHSWSLRHFGLPVRPPAEIPDDVRTVFVGLNPSKARAIVAQTPALNRGDIELVFLGHES